MQNAMSLEVAADSRRSSVSERAEAGVISLLQGTPHLERRHPINLAIQLMITHRGDWKAVLNDKLFLALEHDECMSVLPLAIGEGILNGGDNLRMKQLMDELDPESACKADCRAFSYMTALLVGYLVQRPYFQVERRETEKWLLLATETHFPDIGEMQRHAALRQFDRFFTEPGNFPEMRGDPLLTLVFNTMVAVQNASLRAEWHERPDLGQHRLTAECFVSACNRRKAVN